MPTLKDLDVDPEDFMPPTFQWDSPLEWAADPKTAGDDPGNYIVYISNDDVLDLYQEEMSIDGFFIPEGWVVCPECERSGEECSICGPFYEVVQTYTDEARGYIPEEVADAWEDYHYDWD